MSAYQVAVAFDLRAALFDKALFDIGPPQMYCDQIAVHRFVAPKAEVFHSKSPLSVEVDDLARPSSAVFLQDGLHRVPSVSGRGYRKRSAGSVWLKSRLATEKTRLLRSIPFAKSSVSRRNLRSGAGVLAAPRRR